MKVLYSNITKAIKAKPLIENLCDDLTLIGIEVDEIKSFQGDKIIDFDLTPNRGDCFSVKGLARDYCAYKDKKFSSATKSSFKGCLLYTSPSPRDRNVSRMPSSA